MFPTPASLLIDLSLEWNDFAMWEEILKKSGEHTTKHGLDALARSWGVFALDGVKL